MALYVGLDISLRMTSICVVDADGSSVWEGKAESEPVPLVKVLSLWRDKIALVGIEACPLSEWLYGALVESGFQVVCIETRHAQHFLSSRRNKTDRTDAHGIAEMMRLGHYRCEEQSVTAAPNDADRAQEVRRSHAGDRRHHPWVKLGGVHRSLFAARFETLLADAPDLRMAIEPPLEARNNQVARCPTLVGSTIATMRQRGHTE